MASVCFTHTTAPRIRSPTMPTTDSPRCAIVGPAGTGVGGIGVGVAVGVLVAVAVAVDGTAGGVGGEGNCAPGHGVWGGGGVGGVGGGGGGKGGGGGVGGGGG